MQNIKTWIVFVIALFIYHSHSSAQILKEKGVKTEVKSLKGLINLKIPIFMWYTERDSLIYGQITYMKTKNRTPITIIGQVESGQCRMNEYMIDGNISGIILTQSLQDEINGTWYSPTSGREYPIKLHPFDTTIAPNLNGFEASVESGNYEFGYGEEGNQGHLRLNKLNSHVSFEISNHTGKPSYNQAVVDLDTVTIRNNRFVYSIEKPEDCTFIVRTFKSFVVVDYLSAEDCGFGHKARVDGIYLKIDD